VNHSFSAFEQLPIRTVEDMWPSRQRLLATELGIQTVGDLLRHIPSRYVDKTSFRSISTLSTDDGPVQIKGVLESLEIIGDKRKQRLKGIFSDPTGTMELVWFKSITWVKSALKEGHAYVAFGKVTSFGGQFSISHPEMKAVDSTEAVSEEGYQPIYPLTEKLKASKIDSRFLSQLVLKIFKHPNFELPDFLPATIVNKMHFPSRENTYRMIHFPSHIGEAQVSHDRLKFEEMFLFQLRSERLRHERIRDIKGPMMKKPGVYFHTFYHDHLPFELTDAQKKVIKEIWTDMKSGVQMNRLLQGDVGSGKTIVAFICMILAIDNGCQTCIMAPTEILAQQHYDSLMEWATPIGLRVGLLTGSTSKKDRQTLLKDLEEGRLLMLAGTHALLEDPVVFQHLGLVIIDEQHRFGVAQRARLWMKGNPPPHMLVMTATPIPRTLAMTAHGESDHSILDQLPKGRKAIITLHHDESRRMEIMFFVKSQIEKGRQIYFVFPLIEESEKLDLKNLMDGYDVVESYFNTPQYRIAIVHGRMKPDEKEAEMQRFKSGQAHIMVATTVIEVGVNVPNASVMIIESAERFGLSQLHQLRGRVGRGAEQSYCILMTKGQLGQGAKERMDAMVQHTDGFEIAKIDLKQRGPGDLLGTKQSGLPDFRFVDLYKDENVIYLAREAAKYMMRDDPNLLRPESENLKKFLIAHNHDNFWSRIS
jgi:ATP-dependent DNA helicase RecG